MLGNYFFVSFFNRDLLVHQDCQGLRYFLSLTYGGGGLFCFSFYSFVTSKG